MERGIPRREAGGGVLHDKREQERNGHVARVTVLGAPSLSTDVELKLRSLVAIGDRSTGRRGWGAHAYATGDSIVCRGAQRIRAGCAATPEEQQYLDHCGRN